jgi:hypothetical protein
MTAGLYHGGEKQCPFGTTQVIDSCSNPRWCEWINPSIQMYNIPRALRICFTLYEKRDGAADVPLAWANCQLFDYKHELKTGKSLLNGRQLG